MWYVNCAGEDVLLYFKHKRPAMCSLSKSTLASIRYSRTYFVKLEEEGLPVVISCKFRFRKHVSFLFFLFLQVAHWRVEPQVDRADKSFGQAADRCGWASESSSGHRQCSGKLSLGVGEDSFDMSQSFFCVGLLTSSSSLASNQSLFPRKLADQESLFPLSPHMPMLELIKCILSFPPSPFFPISSVVCSVSR